MSGGEWAEMHHPGVTRLMMLPGGPVISGQWSHHPAGVKHADNKTAEKEIRKMK